VSSKGEAILTNKFLNDAEYGSINRNHLAAIELWGFSKRALQRPQIASVRPTNDDS
jgi:hypothetical protein